MSGQARLYFLSLLVIWLVVTACTPTQEGQGQETTSKKTVPASVVASRTDTPLPPASPTQEKTPATAIEQPTLIPEPATAESSIPATTPETLHDLAIDPKDLSFYPMPAIYAGDLVSIEVAPTIPRGLAPNDVDVQLLVDGVELLTGKLNWQMLSGDTVGLFQWVWDTTDLAGEHSITAVLDPGNTIQIRDENPNNNQVTVTLTVRPEEELVRSEAEATWIVTENDCCFVHVISGTAAQRDLNQILAQVDESFAIASEKLRQPLNEPYHVYVIDRVIGQGGYSTDRMVISYLDRNYAGGGLTEVLTHEATHLIDRQFAPDRITFLSEGLAVWVAEGHYKEHDIGQRMAALVELNRYVPIAQIIDDFFAAQHEISYLEGASLMEYLIDVYGWPKVQDFYREASADDAPTLSEAVDINMRLHFGKTMAEIEADWLAYLKRLPRDLTEPLDLETTIRLYDVMRRYQTIYDPHAYYQYAWLPSPELAEEKGVTADFNRHPDSTEHVVLETMLLAANQALLQGDYDQAQALIDSVERVLDNSGQILDPLSRSYQSIVSIVQEEGYEAQQIVIEGNRATAWVVRPGRTTLIRLQLVMNSRQVWSLSG